MLKYNHSESIPDIKYTYDIGGQFSLTNSIVRYNKPILSYPIIRTNQIVKIQDFSSSMPHHTTGMYDFTFG